MLGGSIFQAITTACCLNPSLGETFWMTPRQPWLITLPDACEMGNLARTLSPTLALLIVSSTPPGHSFHGLGAVTRIRMNFCIIQTPEIPHTDLNLEPGSRSKEKHFKLVFFSPQNSGLKNYFKRLARFVKKLTKNIFLN